MTDSGGVLYLVTVSRPSVRSSAPDTSAIGRCVTRALRGHIGPLLILIRKPRHHPLAPGEVRLDQIQPTAGGSPRESDVSYGLRSHAGDWRKEGEVWGVCCVGGTENMCGGSGTLTHLD